tara:strand:- start:675 stop:953 length:279 start_codon:yes stop_codon:yes gene_type:complete
MSREVPKEISKMAKSHDLEVTMRVGKDGITGPLLSELIEQLKRRDLVKIKANKGVSSNREHRKEIFSLIAERTSSTIVFQRGNIAVFWRTNI